MLVPEGHAAAEAILHMGNLCCHRGPGDVRAVVGAEVHVWVYGPAAAVVCDDVPGQC